MRSSSSFFFFLIFLLFVPHMSQFLVLLLVMYLHASCDYGFQDCDLGIQGLGFRIKGMRLNNAYAPAHSS